MTMKLRILLILTVALGQMFWTSCGHYSCTDTFSANNCSTGGGGGGGIGSGGGGGGGGSASAFAFAVDQTLGSIDGYTLNATNSTFQATSNYIAPTIQFVLGIAVWHEPFDLVRLTGFAVIWLALALYSVEMVRLLRRLQAPVRS